MSGDGIEDDPDVEGALPPPSVRSFPPLRPPPTPAPPPPLPPPPPPPPPSVPPPFNPPPPLPYLAPPPLDGDVDLPPPASVPRPPTLAALRVFPPPRVEDVVPGAGPVFFETRITLSGQNLFRETIVRIDGVIAQTVGAREPNELRVLTPPRTEPGPVEISVENPRVPPTVLAKGFRYEPLPPPKLTGVAPDRISAGKGGELSLLGEGFVKTTVVLIDGQPATSVRFVSPTTLDVKAPGGEHGKLVDVVVKNPDGRSDIARRAFMYDERYG